MQTDDDRDFDVEFNEHCGLCCLGTKHAKRQHDAWIELACDPDDD